MILSMTGFGKYTALYADKKITATIKSLNSKQLDLSTRLSGRYRDRELPLRALVAAEIERGKVDFNLLLEDSGNSDATAQVFNTEKMAYYFSQLKSFGEQMGVAVPAGGWFEQILRMPGVIQAEEDQSEEIPDEEWNIVIEACTKALAQLTDFRRQEGAMLEQVFKDKIANISGLLLEIEHYEPERVQRIKERIEENLTKVSEKDYDKNRFEQEMIYYIEKLDINEEKHRLRNHLSYFLETLQGEAGQGKKLSFIAQEIGREINTLGSKSNHVEMQQIVVRMKDELEQIKEQVLNVL